METLQEARQCIAYADACGPNYWNQGLAEALCNRGYSPMVSNRVAIAMSLWDQQYGKPLGSVRRIRVAAEKLRHTIHYYIEVAA